MDFWARQADARRRSRWLVVVFIAAVLAVALAVNVVVLGILAMVEAGTPVALDGDWMTRHPRAVVVTTLVVFAVIAVANLYRTTSLAAGGGVVARSLGGMRVQADTTDPLQRRLLNVVEEMAIASGVPVPAVYVLEQEQGINAFAAGHTASNAAIAVTQGALRHLDRAEVAGVIGHEFSHILNGDMRLNIRLMGLVFGLLVIALAGRTVFAYAPRRGDGRRGAGLLPIAGLAVMAIGYIGVFFARLIQAAVSRQREFLADAAAVQFTRDSTGLRDALVKIGTVQGSRLAHPQAEEVAHMLFAPGMTRWFATHPPLAERIRVLDPSFDPSQAAALRLEVKPQPLGVVEVVTDDRLPLSFPDPAVLASRSVPLKPADMPGRVGNPGIVDLHRAGALRAALPGDVLAGDDPAAQAVALLFALVLDPQPGARALQVERVRAVFGASLDERLAVQAGRLAVVPVNRRLALLGRLVPALRRLPRATRRQVLEVLGTLCRMDGAISAFEYALCALARVYVAESLAPQRAARAVTLSGAVAELQALLSILASHGHPDEAAAVRAYERGLGPLGLPRSLPFRRPPGWPAALDRALRCLDGLDAAGKARLVEALAATVVHDGEVTVAEAELLRAICASLHCPLPPLAAR